MHVPICIRITSMDACKHAALTGLLRLAEDGVPHGRRFIHLRSYWSLRAYTSASSPTRLLLHHFLPSFLPPQRPPPCSPGSPPDTSPDRSPALQVSTRTHAARSTHANHSYRGPALFDHHPQASRCHPHY